MTGEVEWGYQRQSAASAVRYLMGVKGVSDQIAVKPKMSYATVKADIEGAFKRRAKADLSVAVNGGDVVLTGNVHSWWERELASQAAWGTPGVSSVVNNVAVTY